MTAEPHRHLQVVDPDSGELVDCPGCQERDHLIEQLNRKHNGVLSELGRLRSDKEQDARGHKLFPTAKRLHDQWRNATGHKRAQFTAEDFHACLPYLRNPEFGELYISIAIRGIAYDPIQSSKPNKNGRYEVYDQWHNLFKNRASLARYFDRAPERGAELLLERDSKYPAHELNLSRYMPDGATPWSGPLPEDWAMA